MPEIQSPLYRFVDLLYRLQPCADSHRFFVVREKKLVACHRSLVKPGDQPIIELSQYDINNGLTSKQWNIVEAKCREYRQKGFL